MTNNKRKGEDLINKVKRIKLNKTGKRKIQHEFDEINKKNKRCKIDYFTMLNYINTLNVDVFKYYEYESIISVSSIYRYII